MLKLLFVVIVVGLAVYATIRLLQQDSSPMPKLRTRPRPQARRQAPDDDEDFLRDLDRKRTHPEDPKADPPA